MPKPLIKNQYPGAAGGDTRKTEWAFVSPMNSAVQLQSAGIDHVARVEEGVWDIYLKIPLPYSQIAPSGAVRCGINVTIRGGPTDNSYFYSAWASNQTVSIVRVYLAHMRLNDGVWTCQNIDAEFWIEIVYPIDTDTEEYI